MNPSFFWSVLWRLPRVFLTFLYRGVASSVVLFGDPLSWGRAWALSLHLGKVINVVLLLSVVLMLWINLCRWQSTCTASVGLRKWVKKFPLWERQVWFSLQNNLHRESLYHIIPHLLTFGLLFKQRRRSTYEFVGIGKTYWKERSWDWGKSSCSWRDPGPPMRGVQTGKVF